MPSTPLLTRQSNNNNLNDDDDYLCNGYYCYSYNAWLIKWIVFGAIMALLLVFFVGGYVHAKRRMKKGLAPLGYHRWLVPRRTRIAFHNAHPNLPNPFILQAQRSWYTPGYGMHSMPTNAQGGYYGPPPPQYGTPEYLPAYTAPPQQDGTAMNAAKTNPNQVYTAPVQSPPPVGAGSGSPQQALR